MVTETKFETVLSLSGSIQNVNMLKRVETNFKKILKTKNKVFLWLISDTDTIFPKLIAPSVKSEICDCKWNSERELVSLKNCTTDLASAFIFKEKACKKMLLVRERCIYFERCI